MINPSSSAFVSEQMMDPKPLKKQNRNKNKTPPCFSRTLPVLLPHRQTPELRAEVRRCSVARAHARARVLAVSSFGLLSFASALFRSKQEYLPTSLPTYLPTVPYLHTYLLTMRIVLFFDDFYTFGMKNWTLQGRNPTFHVPIIWPTTTHVQHKLLVPHKLIHEQLCPLPPQKKEKKKLLIIYLIKLF
jgi:hypothetical protein